MGDTTSPANETLPKSVEAHYIKSNAFRVIHADGVWGGLTPSGFLHAIFWSQRTAVPQEIEYSVSPDGSIGPELRRKGKQGLVREMEVDAVFGIEFAKALRTWLDEKIQQYEQAETGTAKNKREK